MDEIIDGIPVRIAYKKIKNLYIKVLPQDGQVVVSIPHHTSGEVLFAFIHSHRDWILQKQKEIKERKPPRELLYVSDEEHYLWGETYRLVVERSLKKPMTELREMTIYMRVTAHSTVEERRKQLDKWYVEQMKIILPDMIERCESKVGKHADEWTFRSMKTRWGTCNIQKKKICLNIQLAKKTLECLEYVVTHELNHLHEAGHNKRFWGLMDQFYPAWRQVRKKLNETEN